MFEIGILDCTLRDGAYVVDTYFGDNTIFEIVKSLVEAGIDIIECGFLRNKSGGEGSTVFSKPSEIKKYIPEGLCNSKFVLMFDAGKLDVEKIPANDGTLFGIRDCFHKDFIDQAFQDAEILKQKGYKIFIQPTGILQYTDVEIIELIKKTNLIGAYSFAIVDTFGSMDKSDLLRLFSLINHNLDDSITLSFHSHNNQQMAYALSQDFVELGFGKRKMVVDSTVYGMGRGAGNTCTESVAFHLNKYYKKQYNTEKILDLIESQILQIYDHYSWGYNVRNLVAGINGCHVDNISYLYDKGYLLSSDVKRIMEVVPSEYRIHFFPDVLETTLSNYKNEYIDDNQSIEQLRKKLAKKDILVLCPGRSISSSQTVIKQFYKRKNVITIGVNFIPELIECNYLFFSNPQRVHFWNHYLEKYNGRIILTSNIQSNINSININYRNLVISEKKYGANAAIMCLRLLDQLDVGSIYLAGFDGYSDKDRNYLNRESENSKNSAEIQLLNYEISEMFDGFRRNMQSKRKIEFITKSKFERVM